MTPLFSLVPVPYVPPQPPLPTAGTTLTWTLGILGVTALLGFTVFTVRAILNIPFRKHEVRVAAWLSFGGMALVAACYVDWRVHHYRQDLASDTWWEARQEADDVAQAALEETYGITFTDDVLVFPIEEEPYPWEMGVELADGTPSTCWLSNANQFFAISCGADRATAAPLVPLGDGRSERSEDAAVSSEAER